jgi:glutamyl-tRNA synthetase
MCPRLSNIFETATLEAMRGRFAPSPTGTLHLGNLRTAMVAWLSARSQHGSFIVRMEDLDPVTSSLHHEQRQLSDLAELGIEPDGDVVRQSERFDLYREAIGRLTADGRIYPCYCTRREIREAASAPHDAPVGDAPVGEAPVGEAPVADGAYPGTCRELTQQLLRQHERAGRRPALRLRTDGERLSFVDLVAGHVEGIVDDVVVQRNDGVPAYNLAVVVDDHLQGITEVARGDDLLSSTPRQIHLQRLLGLRTPVYAHVPLAVGPDGQRLAKRHGAVTLATAGTSAEVRALLGSSLGLCSPDDVVTMAELVERFAWSRIPRIPWVVASGGSGSVTAAEA